MTKTRIRLPESPKGKDLVEITYVERGKKVRRMVTKEEVVDLAVEEDVLGRLGVYWLRCIRAKGLAKEWRDAHLRHLMSDIPPGVVAVDHDKLRQLSEDQALILSQAFVAVWLVNLELPGVGIAEGTESSEE